MLRLHYDADELFQQGSEPVPHIHVSNFTKHYKKIELIVAQCQSALLRYIYHCNTYSFFYPLRRFQHIRCCEHNLPTLRFLGHLYWGISPQHFSWRSKRAKDDCWNNTRWNRYGYHFEHSDKKEHAIKEEPGSPQNERGQRIRQNGR